MTHSIGARDSFPTQAAALPAGWSKALDPSSGRTYYMNPGTNTTTWERPTAVAVVAPPQAAHGARGPFCHCNPLHIYENGVKKNESTPPLVAHGQGQQYGRAQAPYGQWMGQQPPMAQQAMGAAGAYAASPGYQPQAWQG